MDFKYLREDRISSFPDEIVTNIISFLPTTEEAIRTSILSTRWKNLWTCIPNHNLEYIVKSSRVSWSTIKSFFDSVDRLFNLCEPGLSIKTFRIKPPSTTIDKSKVTIDISKVTIGISKVKEWTSFLVSRNIEEFHLSLCSFVCQFPSCLLTCETLVDLKLDGDFNLNISTSVFMPNLKTLHLKSITYYNHEHVSTLLSGCPILEDLAMIVLDSSYYIGVKILNISVPLLKKLWIEFKPYNNYGDYGIAIDAPNLEYLGLYDHGSTYISLNNMSSLVEARVDVSRLIRSEMGKFVSAISNVKRLTLPDSVVDYLRLAENRHLPKFHQTEHLAIGKAKDYCSWEWLPNLLESMPKLQELDFMEGLADWRGHDTKFKWSHDRKEVPVCLSFHLKKVKLFNFCGGEDELKVVRYFLENAKVLESMTLRPAENCPYVVVEDGIKQLKQWPKIAKVSEKVKIHSCGQGF